MNNTTKLTSLSLLALASTALVSSAATVSFAPVQELALDGSNINTSGTQIAATTANTTGSPGFTGIAAGVDFSQGGITTTAAGFIGPRNTGLGARYEVDGDANVAAALAGINFASPQTITISGLAENTTYRFQLASLDAPNVNGAGDAGTRSQVLSSGGSSQAFTHFFTDLDDPATGTVGLSSDPNLGGGANPFIGVTAALITADFTTGAGETSVDFELTAVGNNDNTIFNFGVVHQVPEPSSTLLLALAALPILRRRR